MCGWEFDAVKLEDERVGRSDTHRSTTHFAMFIQEAALMDLPMVGD